jgi:hypothetical protein
MYPEYEQSDQEVGCFETDTPLPLFGVIGGGVDVLLFNDFLSVDGVTVAPNRCTRVV